jgi:large subunit ribosomal protein L4
MAEIAVKNLAGEQVQTIELSDEVFGARINIPLMHQAAVRLQADRRLGTHKAKTRSEVRGGGAKPWRQKGTGRARQGTRNSPLWRGGGVAFPPTPRKYAVNMPKKMRRAATRSALTSRIADNGIVVVTSLLPDEPKTKFMVGALAHLEARGRVLMIDKTVGELTVRAARNIPGVKFKPASTLNIVDVLDHDILLFTVDAIRELERLLSNGNA